MEAKDAEVKELLEKRDLEVKEVKKRLKDQERERQSELLKLQMEVRQNETCSDPPRTMRKSQYLTFYKFKDLTDIGMDCLLISVYFLHI